MDEWSADLGFARHGQELFDPTALVTVDRDLEQPVAVADAVGSTVGGDPQVSGGVEGHIVRAGDR